MTKTKDPGGTFDPISVEERSVMIKQVQSDANTLFTMILAQEWKFDNEVYRKSDNCRGPITEFGINAIG